jgi:hypothetical protein
VFLSDVGTHRYLRGRDLALLFAAAILENVGCRQLSSWWGCVGTVQAMTGAPMGIHDRPRLLIEKPASGASLRCVGQTHQDSTTFLTGDHGGCRDESHLLRHVVAPFAQRLKPAQIR